MTSNPDVFVFFGHGWETMTTEFEDRQTLPPGVTLVTFSECGIPTQLPSMVSIVQKMTTENMPILSKIATDQSKETIQAIQTLLDKKIRVYTNGAKYPDLLYASLGTFCPPAGAKGQEYLLSVKSGVHKAPFSVPEVTRWKYNKNVARQRPTGYALPITDVEGDKFLERCSLIPAGDFDTLKKTYDDAVFPNEDTIDEVIEKQKKKRDGTLEVNEDEDIFFPIGDVFKALKKDPVTPSVYYWPICRGRADDEPPEVQKALPGLRSQSNEAQPKFAGRKTYRKMRRNRRKTYRKKRRVRKAH